MDYRDEIIRFVKTASEVDNLMLATFIAGMQAEKMLSEPEKSLFQVEGIGLAASSGPAGSGEAPQ